MCFRIVLSNKWDKFKNLRHTNGSINLSYLSTSFEVYNFLNFWNIYQIFICVFAKIQRQMCFHCYSISQGCSVRNNHKCTQVLSNCCLKTLLKRGNPRKMFEANYILWVVFGSWWNFKCDLFRTIFFLKSVKIIYSSAFLCCLRWFLSLVLCLHLVVIRLFCFAM